MTEAAAPQDGLLLLDKPVGISSFQALYPVKRIFRGRKIGHAGTLDPAASGLLVVGVGSGTRLLEFLESCPKRYRFGLRLGTTTDTYDLEGTVLERRDASAVTALDLERLLPRFRGAIVQMPPVYSAVKIQGKRACDRVRAGEIVELTARNVRIDRLDLIELREGAATLEMDCSKGTYVRAVAHDLGHALGCGAAAEQIRRLAIGPFGVEGAIAPDAVRGPENLLPLEKAVEHLPALQLRPSWVGPLLNGNAVPAAGYVPMARPPAGLATGLETFGAEPPGETSPYGVFSPAGRLMAIATVSSLGQLPPRKVLPA
jgi:tRNA pseudouridine55 synthase